jgi:small GTP-binding protein
MSNNETKQQPKKKTTNILKLLTLGNSCVGKSSIVIRYTENKFYSSYLTTIGVDFLRKVITVGDKEINLQIWDSAGQEKYNSISKQYYNKADGIILVFDLNSRMSFDGMMNWLEEIEVSTEKGIPIVIVGNKCDLTTREITTDEAYEFAETKNIPYFETSAMTGHNINEAINKLVEIALEFQEKKNNDKKVVTLNTNGGNKERCCK